MTARVPLTAASAQTCSRKLVRGQVKRVMQRGPLIGYFLCCPACGFSASYLHESEAFEGGVGFVEEPADPLLFPKTIVRFERPPRCMSCQRLLVVEGGFFEARDLALTPEG